MVQNLLIKSPAEHKQVIVLFTMKICFDEKKTSHWGMFDLLSCKSTTSNTANTAHTVPQDAHRAGLNEAMAPPACQLLGSTIECIK